MGRQKFTIARAAIPGLIAFMLLLAILAYPKQAYQSALSGLDIFLHSVFPALLPFFIASEIIFITRSFDIGSAAPCSFLRYFPVRHWPHW